jgi:hypothetical protein
MNIEDMGAMGVRAKEAMTGGTVEHGRLSPFLEFHQNILRRCFCDD